MSDKFYRLIVSPITLLLIGYYLTPRLQGYYYTFYSLIALQAFFELGLYMVVQQFASHEWAHLGFDAAQKLTGSVVSRSRLASLFHLIVRWYAVICLLYVITVGVLGFYFFNAKGVTDVVWLTPWLALIFIAALQLWVFPILSFLEGCNQVSRVNQFRFINGISSYLALWLCLYVGGGLWSVPVFMLVGLVTNVVLIVRHYSGFFSTLRKTTIEHKIDWKSEILPMQWRLALGGVVVYFAFSLFTPVLFHYHGAEAAGRMGMSWSLCSSLSVIAASWVQTKVPRFGMLISTKEYGVLDSLFFRTSAAAFLTVCVAALVIWLLVYALNSYQHPFAQRMLDPLSLAVFLAATILLQIHQAQAYFLRAHKVEPLFVLGVVASLLIGLSTWFLGKSYGALGIALGYFMVVASVIVPFGALIFYRFRTEWRLSHVY